MTVRMLLAREFVHSRREMTSKKFATPTNVLSWGEHGLKISSPSICLCKLIVELTEVRRRQRVRTFFANFRPFVYLY